MSVFINKTGIYEEAVSTPMRYDSKTGTYVETVGQRNEGNVWTEAWRPIHTLGDLPAGALVKDTGTIYNGATIIWRKEGAGHSQDPANSVILASRDIITLKCFDSKETSNSNNESRQKYGNNRYSYSNLLQWLNSDAAAGKWYSAQHSADEAPTKANATEDGNEYDQEAGFLTNFSEQMKAALLTVGKVTVKDKTDGGDFETVESKIFLESVTEVGADSEDGIEEGETYEYYSSNNTNNRRIRKPTAEAVSKSDYQTSSFNASSGWYYWLRTRFPYGSAITTAIKSNGKVDSAFSYHSFIGVAPSYALPASTAVSKGEDGVYIIEW